jgi:hypothetical protein
MDKNQNFNFGVNGQRIKLGKAYSGIQSVTIK